MHYLVFSILALCLTVFCSEVITKMFSFQHAICHSPCKKCPNSEFLQVLISHIQTEYGHLQSRSLHAAWMREIKDQKNLRIGILFLQWLHFHVFTEYKTIQHTICYIGHNLGLPYHARKFCSEREGAQLQKIRELFWKPKNETFAIHLINLEVSWDNIR